MPITAKLLVVAYVSAAVTANVLGCTSTKPLPIMQLPLKTGALIADLVSESDTTMLLIYDPADCLACGNPIGVWLAWETSSPRRSLALVLTREPSPADVRALATARAMVKGLLQETARFTRTPAAYYIVAHRIVDSAVGRPALSSLMTRITERPMTPRAIPN